MSSKGLQQGLEYQFPLQRSRDQSMHCMLCLCANADSREQIMAFTTIPGELRALPLSRQS